MKDSVLILSVGQALEVQGALRRQGLPLSFLKGVTSGTWFSQLNEVMEGRAKIVPIQTEPVVTPALSTIPDAFRVDYSIKGTYPDWMKKRMHTEFDRADTVEYRLDQVKPWLHSTQENGRSIVGNDLYQYIKTADILPSCLSLRDLEEIQKLGIEVFRRHFRGKAVFAWKDVVRLRFGVLFVPCLYEYDVRVVVGWYWLDNGWDVSRPALRFAS